MMAVLRESPDRGKLLLLGEVKISWVKGGGVAWALGGEGVEQTA